MERMTINTRYLTITELSSYIGVPKGTLYVWVCQRRIPYVKIGSLLRFDTHEIENWIKMKRVAEFV